MNPPLAFNAAFRRSSVFVAVAIVGFALPPTAASQVCSAVFLAAAAPLAAAPAVAPRPLPSSSSFHPSAGVSSSMLRMLSHRPPAPLVRKRSVSVAAVTLTCGCLVSCAVVVWQNARSCGWYPTPRIEPYGTDFSDTGSLCTSPSKVLRKMPAPFPYRCS